MGALYPVYIVPLLVEQPTWGGEYIANSKRISHSLTQGKRIGQAFELFGESWVTTDPNQNFAYATATNLAAPEFAQQEALQKLQDIIDQDITGTLGSIAAERGWTSMQVLIKFTQAQNNSYQVHVIPKKEFGKWQPKPESWYFLEKGKATLGLVDVTQANAYKQRCLEIDAYAHQVSDQVRAGALTLADGKAQLKAFIDQDHPRRFVHTVQIEPEAVIDLSQGGVHHSWEMGSDVPQGNIVYEVQVNVMDDFCTIRSFDQGNMKDDGSVRPLAIEDYFSALDLAQEHNQPEFYLRNTTTEQEGTASIRTLFKNQYYVSELITMNESYQGKYTTTGASFHHVYALDGDVVIKTSDQELPLRAGWSLFIPAVTGTYTITPASSAARMIITHL